MIRHALHCAMLAASILAVGACAGAPAPSADNASRPVVTSTPAGPTPAATPSASAASPDAAMPGRLVAADLNKPLEAGVHRTGKPFGAPFAITLPGAWQLRGLEAGDAQFAATTDGSHFPAWIVLDLIENVFADPCHSADGPMDPPVAHDVAAIVDALTKVQGFDAGPVADTSLGGFSGKTLELTNAIDTDTAGCTGGQMLPIWTFKGGSQAATNGHAREQLWVLDVDGTPVIIDGETFDNTPLSLRDAIQPIVETIRFE